MNSEAPTKVAILGTDTLIEDILGQLLEGRGYEARLFEAHPTGLSEELLDGVDVLLLTPGLDEGSCEAFLGSMQITPHTSSFPVISLDAKLKEALLDQPDSGMPWEIYYEVLVRQIDAAVRSKRAATGTPAPLMDDRESPEDMPRSEAAS